MTATVRSCLAASVAVLTAAALAGLPGEPAEYLAAGPDGVTGGSEVGTDEAVSLRAARETGKPVQVKSLTSETTEVYALPNGQFRADIAAGMQRFRRGGDWVRVDLTLKVQPDGSVAPTAHPNDLRISGAKDAGEHELAAVGAGDDRVAMGWSGALPKPVLAANRATYVDARPGVDLVVEATRLGFEQFLVVKNRTALAHVGKVSFPFSGPGVATSKRGADGSITLTNGAGEQTAHIPAPLMWDAKRNAITGAPAVEKPVRTELATRGDTVELTLAPDSAWLRDPATAYPVTIDPTVNPLGTTFDTYVKEGVGTDKNQEKDLQVGLLDPANPRLTRSFLTWDTTVLAGKQINSATVSFWNFWSHTCTATSWEIWTTAPSTYTTTFTNQPTWDTAGPDARSTATAGGGAGCTSADGWVSIDGKTFFQKAATADKTRAGMGVRATDEANVAGFKQFRSREGDVATEDPKATVTYNSWPTVTARSTVPTTSCVTGSGRPLVNTLTPQLKATVADGDGTAMTVTFEWWTLNGTTALGSTAFTAVASGATATATVPAGAFTEGGSYKWRVKAADGTVGSDIWSSFCEMTVYETAPPVAGCTGGTDSDFNGDGIADIAIADPEASVNGLPKAGQIQVAYGGTGTVQTLHENNSQVAGAVEAGDQFGYSVSAYDANNDGCTDLAVGVPYEDLGTTVDVGVTYVLLGTPTGLAKGPASLSYHQDVGVTPDQIEPYDYFGFSVAGSRTPSGQSYLVVGVPGEDVGTAVDAGVAHYFRGSLNILFQAGALIPGAAEHDDQTGYAVAASTNHFAIGSPGEAIGTLEYAGAVNVFSSHELVNGSPKLAAGLTQDAANVSNVSEANDTFGKSISIAPYRPVGAPVGQADSLVVVGVPGEDITVAATNTPAPDAGMVHRFHVTAGATYTELPGITYSSEDGDYLGEKVVVVNTAPGSEGTNSTMFIAIGVPGEDEGTVSDSGRVRVFPALADPIGTPKTIHRQSGSLPGTATAQELIGTSLGATSQHLYVGSPYGDAAVYGVTWSGIASGSTAPTATWKPGQGNIPAGETAFGAAIG
ncbi:DNRLRE domain-containing protein [Micromonospora sp. NPDC047707]|uniref:DNRLRE domain-containing protein n=1 Tax=Micromonospora sp. NPDC047707 TaxID=3154498 RepID=UPI003452A434